MKTRFAALLVVALIGLRLPTSAAAAIITYSCESSAEPTPPDWSGGPWPGPVRLVIDTTAKTAELFDKDNLMLATTVRQGRLAGLNNYQIDLSVTENVISWGVVEMWGFSGYINRQNGRLDLLWVNSNGAGADTFNRQFHGTCKQR